MLSAKAFNWNRSRSCIQSKHGAERHFVKLTICSVPPTPMIAGHDGRRPALKDLQRINGRSSATIALCCPHEASHSVASGFSIEKPAFLEINKTHK